MAASSVRAAHWRPLWVAVSSTVLLVGLAHLVGVRGLYLVIGCALAPVLGLLLARPPQGLRMQVAPVLRARVGGPVLQQVVFSNNGSRPSPPCRVLLATEGLTDAELWCPQLRPGGSATAEVQRTGLRRGIANSHQARVESTGLGGEYHPLQLELPGRTIVHPAGTAPLPTQPHDRGEDGDPIHRGGHEPSGVRQWAPGDSRRGIHWRATARHGTLVVTDREQPAAEVFGALIVGDVAFSAEDALAMLASGAVAAVRAGIAVRVVHATSAGLTCAPVITATALLDWFAQLPAEEHGRTVGTSVLPEPAAVLAVLGDQGAWLVRGGASGPWLSAVSAGCELTDLGTARVVPAERR